SAANRIRTAEGSRVAVVLPYGSRVATSRINFRLLARDAQTNGKRLSVIAGDAATRALAASAGLPIFATVSEYETSLEDGGGVDATGVNAPAGAPAAADTEGDAEAPADVPPPKPARRRRSPRQPDASPEPLSWVPDDTSATAAVTGSPAVAATGLAASEATVVPPRPAPRKPAAVSAERVVADSPARERPVPVAAGPTVLGRPIRLDAIRLPVAVGAAILALALVVGGVAAYLFLPTATAVITPRESTIGPVSLRITASTTATAPDAVARIVPAETKTVDVEASQRFPATGKRVEESTATGTVRFRNKDFTRSNTIPRGSIVSTQSGIRFRTNAAVTVPRAELVGLQIFPASANVKVTAVEAGPEANVEPNTILTIPRGEDPQTLDVTNPDATKGGGREEFPRVIQADVDAATASLGTQLQSAFEAQVADPELGGGSATVFPATASLGEPEFAVDVATLVGQEVEGFDLAATASGTVLAVDEGPVQAVAEANIDSSVEPGYTLVDGSGQVDPAPAVVENGVITFPVVVTARQVLIVDPAAIELEIRGRSLADARAILDRYGSVELSVWPDWVGTIPTFDARVEVTTSTPITVDGPSAAPEPSP
ncbi:MAG: baseplate J/gp47 family protein, partial [Candidatus Limnocylindrales bacterium]